MITQQNISKFLCYSSQGLQIIIITFVISDMASIIVCLNKHERGITETFPGQISQKNLKGKQAEYQKILYFACRKLSSYSD